MDDLEIPAHVVAVLSKIRMRANRDLLGSFDIVHSVVVVAGIDRVPVAHHLPASGRAAQRRGDDFVCIVGGRRVQEEFHVPHVVFPHHHLKAEFLEVPVRSRSGLVVDEESAAPAGVRQLGTAAVDGMAGKAAQLVRRR